ncbi:MAG: hypothetical protein IAE91_05630, partial [Ignavibacteriaceae bacterium]|nr:hypothetical protein [Ignavibacteriaceae bacterium]
NENYKFYRILLILTAVVIYGCGTPEREIKIFTNFNSDSLFFADEGRNPSNVTIDFDEKVTKIKTLHRGVSNNEKVQLTLIDESGNVLGNWDGETEKMADDSNTYYRIFYSKLDIKPGSYKVVLSNTSGWVYNAQSGNSGFVSVYAILQTSKNTKE